MAKVLLHICCGPCASACVERLRGEGHDVTLFFSNANIAPKEEYARRLEAAGQLADAVGAPLVEDAGVTHDDWLEQVARGFEAAPEGGSRCRRCFAFNLARAARHAAENGFDAFTTSLTVSPHKRSATVFEAGREAGGDRFMEEDFKKRDGFRRSIELAKLYGLYRQDYCGCEFSRRAREKTLDNAGGPRSCATECDPVDNAGGSRSRATECETPNARGRSLSPALPQAFHEHFMRLALDEAAQAGADGEVPTGCVIIEAPADSATPPEAVRILARAHNMTETRHNPAAHAEMLAITAAAEAIGDFRLTDTILYVTKEPCAMCAGAVVLARIPTVVWGVDDPKRGGESLFGILSSEALIHRAQTIHGVLGDEARNALQSFFRERRRPQLRAP